MADYDFLGISDSRIQEPESSDCINPIMEKQLQADAEDTELDLAYLREEWITSEMKNRQSEFTEKKPLRIFLGTYNVNGQRPTGVLNSLNDWIKSPKPVDIFAIGLQEVVDLADPRAVVFDQIQVVAHQASMGLGLENTTTPHLTTSEDPVNEWDLLIEKTLKEHGYYFKVFSKRLVGTTLGIWVLSSHMNNVSQIVGDSVAVGILGVVGNKGGVACRLKIYDSTICFVSAHLAAHKENTLARNNDFSTINQREMNCSECDHVLWMGDFNYRLNSDNLDTVYKFIDNNQSLSLLPQDQLSVEKNEGRTFRNFYESPIKFPPTYKFTPGTLEYDRREDKKKRFPAWTDRILWRKDKISSIESESYKSTSSLLLSDHIPVSNTILLQARIIVPSKQQQVHISLLQQLDKWENETIPMVQLSVSSLNFPKVYLDQPISKQFTINNIGQVLARWSFASKPQETSIHPSWIQLSSNRGLIPPGESVTITVIASFITKTPSAQININHTDPSLNDILVIRLQRGRDFFLEINTLFQRTCFSSTLEYLVETACPVRQVNTKTTENNKCLLVPKELWRLIDKIHSEGLDTYGIFEVTGSPYSIQAIKECLDTGLPFESSSTPVEIFSVAECLVLFLSSLINPVFPSQIFAQYNREIDITLWCKQALKQLSTVQYNTFIYIISFLRDLLKHSTNNGLTPDKLVLIFSPCLMQARKGDVIYQKILPIFKHYITSPDLEE